MASIQFLRVSRLEKTLERQQKAGLVSPWVRINQHTREEFIEILARMFDRFGEK